jgi:uncharacterized membrane protein (DUF485 family)
MPSFTSDRVRNVLESNSFRQLIRQRSRMRWTFSSIAVFMFFGFIALTSTTPTMFATLVPGSRMPVGLVFVFALVVAIVVLTGFYVRRSNSHFEALMQAVRKELKQ